MYREAGPGKVDRRDWVEDSFYRFVDCFPGRWSFSDLRPVEARLPVDPGSSTVVFECPDRFAMEEQRELSPVSVERSVAARTLVMVQQNQPRG